MFMSRFIHQEIVQAAIQAEHLHAVFDRKDKVKQPTAGVYAIPSPDADPDSNEFIVFKIISMHPERRSYLQRAFSLSPDVPCRTFHKWLVFFGKLYVMIVCLVTFMDTVFALHSTLGLEKFSGCEYPGGGQRCQEWGRHSATSAAIISQFSGTVVIRVFVQGETLATNPQVCGGWDGLSGLSKWLSTTMVCFLFDAMFF
jgi:hypothetical protein